MRTRQQHNRLDRLEESAGQKAGDVPNVAVVRPDEDADPPRQFASEDALRRYFDDRRAPNVVIFPPASECPEPDQR